MVRIVLRDTREPKSDWRHPSAPIGATRQTPIGATATPIGATATPIGATRQTPIGATRQTPIGATA